MIEVPSLISDDTIVNSSPLETSIPELTNPDLTARYIQFLHAHPEIPISNANMDLQIFGENNTVADYNLTKSLSPKTVREKYEGERMWYPSGEIIWTSYDLIRALVHELEPTEDTTFYDLGSGYGRLVLYMGLTSLASCKGIELFGERVAAATEAKESLGLDNVEFIEGNVLDQDISDGDVFFMYSPFSEQTFQEVLLRLEAVAEQKTYTLAARGNASVLSKLPWLKFQKEVRVGSIPGFLTANEGSVAILESQ